MKLASDQEARIKEILSAIESGHAGPAAIALAFDGPGGIQQVSYGKHQATEFTRGVERDADGRLTGRSKVLPGSLRGLLRRYAFAPGAKFGVDMARWVDRVGHEPSLASDEAFLRLLRNAGSLDPVMSRVQDEFFDEAYFKPARRYAERELGLQTALGMAVLYDTWVQGSGAMKALRKSFPALPPSKGGDEGEWLAQYLEARRKWLVRIGLQRTTYRITALEGMLKAKNWDLRREIASVNGRKFPQMPEVFVS